MVHVLDGEPAETAGGRVGRRAPTGSPSGWPRQPNPVIPAHWAVDTGMRVLAPIAGDSLTVRDSTEKSIQDSIGPE